MKNPISKRVAAALAFRSDDISIAKENRYAKFVLLISTTIVGLILLLIYKELKSRAFLHQKIDERTRELLVLNEKLEEMAKKLTHWLKEKIKRYLLL